MTFTCTWCYVTGWGGVGIIPTLSFATLHDLGSMLNLLRYLTFICSHLHMMLRYWVGWGGVGIIPTLSLATLHALGSILNLLRYLTFICSHLHMMLRYWVGWGGDNTNPVFCYATWSWEYVKLATLLDLHLQSLAHDATLLGGVWRGGDRRWQSLDKFTPSGLNNKDWSNGDVNQNLIQ